MATVVMSWFQTNDVARTWDVPQPTALQGHHKKGDFSFKLPPESFFLLSFGKCNQIFRGLKKRGKKQPEAISDPPELDVRFWASQCISVLLLFLYGLYCDTALGI